MDIKDIVLIASTIVIPIITGIGSYFASTVKAKKDIAQLREQNKLDIEKLMNQHKLDLESLERKHQMDVEKMQIEHNHKIELMQKEMENSLGSDLVKELTTQFIRSPKGRRMMSQTSGQNKPSEKKK